MASTPDAIRHSLLQILPEGHDNAIQQAFYNTAANLFVVLVCGAAIAVYYVLEAFLSPLCWAVLCGTFLHPFKSALTNIAVSWLQTLRGNNTPFIIGIILLPIQLLDETSEYVVAQSRKHVIVICAVCVGLPVAYFTYYFGPLQQILYFAVNLLVLLYDFLGYFQAFWIWTVVVAYVIAVCVLWMPPYINILKHMAVVVWALVLLHVSSYTGPLRVPLFIGVIAFMVVGYLSASHERPDEHAASLWRVLSRSSSLMTIQESGDPNQEQPKESQSDTKGKKSEFVERKLENDMELSLRLEASPAKPELQLGKKKMSDYCFIGLFWGVALTQVWRHLWVIQIVPLMIILLVVKRLGWFMWSLETVKSRLEALFKYLNANSRFDLIAPPPLRGMMKLVIRGDKKVSAALEGYLPKVMSAVLVLCLLVGSLILTVFISVQVHRESMEIVTLSSNVLNKTLHPELSQWLPNNKTMQATLTSMMGNAYQYGREWLARKVHYMIGEHGDKHLEDQILSLWDQVYDKILSMQNSTSQMKESTEVEDVVDITNMSSLWEMAKRTKDFDLNIMAFVQENIGLLMSVLESVWTVVASNISLAVNFFTAVLSVLFGGSSVILNFMLSIVIFITTLFYLLAASGDRYLPIEWFVSLSMPTGSGSGNRFGQAVEEAVSSVFIASFKMAAFYGIYTWLTHTVFGVQIVFIPSALAAMFASVPFLGTYWACFPAVLDLWLVNGKGYLALLLLAAHLFPAYFVDTAIYSDIKGGHPYLTGLAIAGGIYWMGLEGAIFGPIVLCCLIVAVNMYSTMLRPNGSLETSFST